jgi:integrase/recombinase XerD
MKTPSSSFAMLVQEFFCQRLIAQRQASRHTIASYRDTFRLLLGFAEKRLKRTPADLALTDIDPPLVLDFLDHVEQTRGNRVRTRNLRLTAIRSFMKFVAGRDPGTLASVQRVLAIPTKRFDRPLVGFLTRDEIDAILAAPSIDHWSGRRDRVLFATLYNTGARVSEIIGILRRDLSLTTSPFVQLHGKGRKDRSVPLWRTTATALQQWLSTLPASADQPVFPNRAGSAMTRSGVQDRLDRAVRTAAGHCPTLRDRRISPHLVRHSTAMHLLQAGVDLTVIALWLGHESPTTTHMYVEADLKMKQQALEKIPPAHPGAGRYRPPDKLLAFLEGL